mgnify:CR=1 FL=1
MSIANNYYYTSAANYTNKEYGYFIILPFSNCQMFVISNLDTLLANANEDKIRECFREAILMAGGRKQVTIDVYQTYLPVLKKVFDSKQFMIEAPYTNGTGSKMVVCMIKIV